MPVTADILRKLTTMELSASQLEGVLGVIADMQDIEDARRAKQNERKQRQRDKERDCPVTSAGHVPSDVTPEAGKESPPKSSPYNPLKTTPEEIGLICEREPAKPSKARGSRVPDDFWPNATSLAKAQKLGILVTPDFVDSFLDYWRSVPGSKGLKLDWQGTFRNRLDVVSSHKGTQNGTSKGYNTRDSIAQAIEFRRWEETQGGGNGGHEDLALLPGLREGPA